MARKMKKLETNKEYLKSISKYIIEIKFDKIFNNDDFKELNNFIMNKKRAYANQRKLLCNYINHFIEFYDDDDELLLAYLRIKFLIDNASQSYKKKLFINDLYDMILTDSMVRKIKQMTEDNYIIDLDNRKSSKIKINNESLQFTNEHGKILMNISMAMKLFVPLITHYARVYKIKNKSMDRFILNCIDGIASYFEGENDIYNKLYETVASRINSTKNFADKGHWDTVEIEGQDPLFQIENIVNKLYINIIFKYEYSGNVVFMNHASINNMKNNLRKTKFPYNYSQITNIKSEGGLSDLDKIEMNNSKFDESLIILGRENVKQTLKYLKKLYGVEIDKEEIKFYSNNLVVKPFQKELIFQIFAKYFGNIQDLYGLNIHQYSELIIVMKRMMMLKGFDLMQHILSGVVEKTSNNKITKKQYNKTFSSPRYKEFEEKYKDVIDILDNGKILSNYLTIMVNSKIKLVDYHLMDYNGRYINNDPNVICDEFLMLLDLI